MVKEQQKASLLILPIREEPETKAILPGKLFEYLAVGNPILGVGTSEGAMADVLKETAAGKIFNWDESEGVYSYIDDCWNAFKNGQKNEKADVLKYSRRELTHKMTSLFENIISK